jgi:REP element-mobilizing transposase RayT
MRAPFTPLYLHCVWATWDRLPILTSALERPVYAAINAKCQELKSPLIAIGGMPDHVHLLVRLHPAVSVADLVKGVKGSSSHLVTHQLAPGEFFKWQGAYGAFTLSKDDVTRVRAYIERQKDHHRTQDLWQEWEATTVEVDEGD